MSSNHAQHIFIPTYSYILSQTKLFMSYDRILPCLYLSMSNITKLQNLTSLFYQVISRVLCVILPEGLLMKQSVKQKNVSFSRTWLFPGVEPAWKSSSAWRREINLWTLPNNFCLWVFLFIVLENLKQFSNFISFHIIYILRCFRKISLSQFNPVRSKNRR